MNCLFICFSTAFVCIACSLVSEDFASMASSIYIAMESNMIDCLLSRKLKY